MSTLKKARRSSDSGIKYHLKQCLETIMQSYSWNVQYLLPRCVHLARPVANRINLRFFFSHAFSLLAWLNKLQISWTYPAFLFCFRIWYLFVLYFPLPLHKKKRVNQSACESIDWAKNVGLCCKGARACNVITQRDWAHQKAHGVPWRSWSPTTKADFSLWIRQTTQKATIASINTI